MRTFDEQLGVALNHGQQIIEVVGNAAGEPPYGFHFLRLAKLIFEVAALGDVFGDHLEAFHISTGREHKTPAQAHRKNGAIFALPVSLDALDACIAPVVGDKASAVFGVGINIFRQV